MIRVAIIGKTICAYGFREAEKSRWKFLLWKEKYLANGQMGKRPISPIWPTILFIGFKMLWTGFAHDAHAASFVPKRHGGKKEASNENIESFANNLTTA